MKEFTSTLFSALSTDLKAVKGRLAYIAQNPREAFVRFLGSPAGLTLVVMFTAMSGNFENILKAAGSSVFVSALAESNCNRAAPKLAMAWE
jgi:hypothetical protein